MDRGKTRRTKRHGQSYKMDFGDWLVRHSERWSVCAALVPATTATTPANIRRHCRRDSTTLLPNHRGYTPPIRDHAIDHHLLPIVPFSSMDINAPKTWSKQPTPSTKTHVSFLARYEQSFSLLSLARHLTVAIARVFGSERTSGLFFSSLTAILRLKIRTYRGPFGRTTRIPRQKNPRPL